MNPLDAGMDYKKYEYSSLANYTGKKDSSWLKPNEILQMFKNENQDYMKFLAEYEMKKAEMVSLKHELY